MQTCTLAVDIGASSGRHIVGTVQDGRIVLQEVYRFENGVRRKDGHLCWDIDTLAREVVNGLRAAHDAGFAPATIGIDTWAVDFVLLDEAGQRIGDAVAYRDERTEGIREALEKEYGLTFAEIMPAPASSTSRSIRSTSLWPSRRNTPSSWPPPKHF